MAPFSRTLLRQPSTDPSPPPPFLPFCRLPVLPRPHLVLAQNAGLQHGPHFQEWMGAFGYFYNQRLLVAFTMYDAGERVRSIKYMHNYGTHPSTHRESFARAFREFLKPESVVYNGRNPLGSLFLGECAGDCFSCNHDLLIGRMPDWDAVGYPHAPRGYRVTLGGLQSEPALNGRSGICGDNPTDPSSGQWLPPRRCDVHLEANGGKPARIVRVKLANFRCVDAAAAAKILDRFPSFEKIHEAARNDGQSAAGFAAVEGALLKVDKQAPAALRWIMTSNKAHLVALPPNMRLLERIAPEARCRQFIMLSQPPARQARFAALKARHGSKFAWHGSPAENWHCILRSGLRSASGTKLQLHGAAHGAGVYVSTSLSYSIRYAMSARRQHRGMPEEPATPQFNDSFFGSPDLRIIALCEVAEVPGITKSANIWVVPDEDAVATRFLFVYRGEALQARDAAENLNFTSVTLNSNDPAVPSVIDIDALVDLLIGSGDE